MSTTERPTGDKDPLFRTRWNPQGFKTNCGFCAISYALEQQKGTFLDADKIYDMTLEQLKIEKEGNRDPLPRLLIFPGPGVDGAVARGGYQPLGEGGRSPANYTIWAVASLVGLGLKSGDRQLLNSLIEFASRSKPGWKLDDFVEARMDRPGLAAKATFASMKRHVEEELKGNSIIGSIGRSHFVNMSFDPRGEWKVFDAQRNMQYDGRRIKAEFASLDLFERVSTGA